MTLEIRCREHPSYKGERPPRVNCQVCLALHELKANNTSVGRGDLLRLWREGFYLNT